MQRTINKISIIGGPGTGKTTLAIKLSKITNIPKYHIDGIHRLKDWGTRDSQERDRTILDIAKKDKWIFDGTYHDTLEERIRRSDLVIFLDYSSAAQIKGIIKRGILNFNKEREEIPGCKERVNLKFIRCTLSYNRTKRPVILSVLKKYDKKKVLDFRKRQDLNKWLEKFKGV